MTQSTLKSNARESLLEAAHGWVLENGTAGFTLDAVAQRAGVSKGGLLYHFASKDALLEAMLEAQLEGFERALSASLDGAGPGEFTRAFVRASFPERTASQAADSTLLAVVAHRPDLLERVRSKYAAWQDRLKDDGLPKLTATLVRFATDGLYYAELFGLARPDPETRAALITHLLELASPSSSVFSSSASLSPAGDPS